MIRLVALAMGVTGLTAIVAFAWGDENCLEHEPTQVELRGILELRTYPGAPNYEDITSGDEPEEGFYLVLDAPICTTAGADNASAYPQRGVELVQLSIDSTEISAARAFINAQVAVRGALYAAHTGHHHAPLILRVREIRHAS